MIIVSLGLSWVGAWVLIRGYRGSDLVVSVPFEVILGTARSNLQWVGVVVG
jgi:hypothetical protein